ncbi:MAG: FAD-binding oxidoreductase [Pseudomonadota bacterium]
MQDIHAPEALPQSAVEAFIKVVGAEHALTDPTTQTPYLEEWRGTFTGMSPLVLRPGSVEAVAEILKIANAHGIAVVPQAGNTGLVGGQTPHTTNTEVVVSIERLRTIRSVDPDGNTLIVDAGVTLAECQQAAEAEGRLFPLSLPSEGSCRIGGNIATNAGGVGVLAYGNTRQLIMGLEVVLPDGRIMSDLNTLKKNNTGYDLKNLFIGSEGTLGIVTGAVLKLFPLPAEKTTALVGLTELDHAIALLDLAQGQAGGNLTAFEFIPRLMIDLVCKHLDGARDPLGEQYPWYLLLEISGAKADGATAELMEAILADAAERELIVDGVIAGSVAQSKDLWMLREGISEAQKPEGGNAKHDISVPIRMIPEFVRRADKRILELMPDARPIPLGHFGDGNVHYNVIQPVGMNKADYIMRIPEISAIVYDVVTELGGSVSAEHGVGRAKRDAFKRTKDPVAYDVMRDIKRLFDPNGIMNPGKIFPDA